MVQQSNYVFRVYEASAVPECQHEVGVGASGHPSWQCSLQTQSQ